MRCLPDPASQVPRTKARRTSAASLRRKDVKPKTELNYTLAITRSAYRELGSRRSATPPRPRDDWHRASAGRQASSNPASFDDEFDPILTQDKLNKGAAEGGRRKPRNGGVIFVKRHDLLPKP
jgi:hypothetical protein